MEPQITRDTFEILVLIADCELKIGASSDSIESYKCALSILEKENETLETSELNNQVHPKFVFAVHKKIASIHRKIGNIEEAILSLESACKCGDYKEIGLSEIAGVKYNIATSLLAGGKYKSSRNEYEEAIRLYQEAQSEVDDFVVELSKCYMNVGTSYLKERNNDEALRYFDMSMKIRSQAGHPLDADYGLVCIQKGLLYLLTKKYHDAIVMYDTALTCFGPTRKKEIAEW